MQNDPLFVWPQLHGGFEFFKIVFSFLHMTAQQSLLKNFIALNNSRCITASQWSSQLLPFWTILADALGGQLLVFRLR